jgi:hypothetical protein
MIANFFNETKPINFMVLSIMMFITYLISILFAFSVEYSLFYFANKIFYLLLVIFMLFAFDFIIRKNALTYDNSLALFFYVVLFGFFPLSFDNDHLLIANLFLLFSFRKIYSLRTQIRTNEKIFDSAFWIGIASMFYAWSFIYLILVYLAIWIFHKSNPRNVFIPIIGFFVPISFLYVYFLMSNQTDAFNSYWQLDYSFNLNEYLQNKFLFPLLFVLLLAIVSIFPTTKKSLIAKQDFKATWNILIAQLVLSLFIVIVAPQKNGSETIFLFFPLSILYANYIQDIEKYWLKESILVFTLLVYFGVYLV